MRKTILLTGATGALGKDMLRYFLTETDHRLFVLARGKKNLSAGERIKKITEAWDIEGDLRARLTVFNGDVTLPHFGLNEKDLTELRNGTDEFFHVAALTALNGSEEECELINVGGTSHALEIAWDLFRRGKMKRFFYFSTAYVAGSRQTYRSFEDELPENPAFANYYESSKYHAEKNVRQAMGKGLPVTIFRPSIVVGHSRTGEVAEFNVIYPFMKLFAHGILKVLPTRIENSFNIVPCDFVLRASMAIASQAESIGKTYHLVTLNPPTIGMLLDMKQNEFPEMPPIQVVAPDNFRREDLEANERFVYDMLHPYLGYLNDELTFDARNTAEALRGTGIHLPNTDYEFLKTLCAYAVKAGYLVV